MYRPKWYPSLIDYLWSLRLDKIVRITNGKWKQNCYLINTINSNCIIIDPGSDIDLIYHHLNEKKWKPIAVIITHSHIDHIAILNDILLHFKIHAFMHKEDYNLLQQANSYRIIFGGKNRIVTPNNLYFIEASEMKLYFDNISFTVLHTPGHTMGSICIKYNDNLFTGDTILKSHKTRTDLPGGNSSLLKETINNLKSRLDASLTVRPGHGKDFKLGTLWNINDKF
jgi:hydroxyacylglutathione hydrolase